MSPDELASCATAFLGAFRKRNSAYYAEKNVVYEKLRRHYAERLQTPAPKPVYNDGSIHGTGQVHYGPNGPLG